MSWSKDNGGHLLNTKLFNLMIYNNFLTCSPLMSINNSWWNENLFHLHALSYRNIYSNFHCRLKKYWILHLARSLPILEVHRSISSYLRRMEELTLINTIVPLEQTEMDSKPVYLTSIPYPNSKERFSCCAFQSG